MRTQTHANDGFVNLDLPPQTVNDPQNILAEARRLWHTVGWSNLMLKTPATSATVSVIEQLINEGININVTMLFSQSVYEQVAEAYLRGLEALVIQGKEVSTIASVVSISIDRDDTLFDWINTLETRADRLHDTIPLGITLAKVIYQQYQMIYQGDRWQALASLGAQPQRLLWDISNIKNDQSHFLHYIESLVSAGTVLLVSPQTLQEQEHYNLSYNNFTMNINAVHPTLENLESIVSLESIANTLLNNKLQRSQQQFDQLLKTISAKRNSQET